MGGCLDLEKEMEEIGICRIGSGGKGFRNQTRTKSK